MRRLRLEVLAGRYGVARLAPDAAHPDWADGPGMTTVTRTPDELSVVCEETRIPGHVTSEHGLACLQVTGPLPFSATGVLASLAGPLADAQISIFTVSTYDTDYLLLPEADLHEATGALQDAGHRLAEPR